MLLSMKRPFVVIGIVLFLSLTVTCLFGAVAALVFAALGLVGAVISFCVKKLRKGKTLPVVFITLVFGAALYLSFYCFDYLPALKYAGVQAEYFGTSVSLPEYNYDKCYYDIVIEKVNGEDVDKKFKIRLCCNDKLNISPYDKVNFSAVTREIGSDSVLTKLNYMSKRVYLSGFCEQAEIVKTNSFNINRCFLLLQEKLISSIRRALPADNAGILIAMLFGDRSYMSRELSSVISKAGISHLLCVSGLHLSVWCLGLYKILMKLRLSRRSSLCASIGFILLFMAFTGFSPSIVRAGVMLIIYMLGELIFKESDSVTSLCVAAIIVLLNPFNAMSVSFIMSFTSTLGILSLAVPFNSNIRPKIFNIKFDRRLSRRIIYYFVCLAAVSVSAVIANLPVSVLVFGNITLISLVSNILIIPIASLMMVGGFLSAVPGMLDIPVVKVLFSPIVFVTEKLSDFAIIVSKFTSTIRFGNINARNVYILIWLILSGCILLAVYIFARKSVKAKAIICCFLAVSFVSFAVGADASIKNKLYIRALNVSNGYCVVAAYKGEAVLIDCGGTLDTLSQIDYCFEQLKVDRIDKLVLTGSALKYSGSLNGVIRKYPVNEVIECKGADDKSLIGDYTDAPVNNNGYVVENLWNIGRFSFYGEECGVVLLEVGDNRIFICTHSNIDMYNFPEQFLNYNCAVMTDITDEDIANCPQNGIIVLNDDMTNSSEGVVFVNDMCGCAQFVCKGQRIKLQRVNLWVS